MPESHVFVSVPHMFPFPKDLLGTPYGAISTYTHFGYTQYSVVLTLASRSAKILRIADMEKSLLTCLAGTPRTNLVWHDSSATTIDVLYEYSISLEQIYTCPDKRHFYTLDNFFVSPNR